MEEKVKNILIKNFKPTDTSVLAVSGGVDSVVLLDLLSKYFKNLVIAHVNHGIRKESDVEEDFVRELAEKYNLPLHVKKLKLVKGTEEEARKSRYQYLRKTKETVGAKYIFTAHHADDQLETIILNLTRGCGPLEVWGMRMLEEDIARPLLSFSKEEIISYAKNHKLKFMVDKSNFDPKYTRNRVRKYIIPQLLTINPGLYKTVNNEVLLGEELSGAIDYYVSCAEKKVKIGNTVIIPKLLENPLFIQKEIIRRSLHEMTGKKEGIYSKNVEEVLRLTQSKGTKKTKISRFTIEKIYDKIVFDVKPEKVTKKASLELGKSTAFNGFTVTAEIGSGRAEENNVLLEPHYGYNLSIRTWQSGDRIKTKSGTKKLQNIFTDAKVPAAEREKWPVVLSGNEIVWVPLLAASKNAQRSSKEALIIKVKK